MEKFFALIFLAFFVVLSCNVAAEENPVLVKIGSGDIKLTDFNRKLSYYDADKQKALDESPVRKATLLKRYVQAEALTMLARKEGFDKRPDIKEKTDMMLNDLIANEYLKFKVTELSSASVLDEEIKMYYKAHKDEFTAPEMVRARHILVRVDKSASEGEKKAANSKLSGILKRAKAGEDFAKLAAEFSEDPGAKEKGGDLGFFQKGSMVSEFETAAFSLKPGEISGIVETQFGHHIIKVEEKKSSVLEPFESVSRKIKDKILSDRKTTLVQKLIDKAMKDAGVEINVEPFMPKN